MGDPGSSLSCSTCSHPTTPPSWSAFRSGPAPERRRSTWPSTAPRRTGWPPRTATSTRRASTFRPVIGSLATATCHPTSSSSRPTWPCRAGCPDRTTPPSSASRGSVAWALPATRTWSRCSSSRSGSWSAPPRSATAAVRWGHYSCRSGRARPSASTLAASCIAWTSTAAGCVTRPRRRPAARTAASPSMGSCRPSSARRPRRPSRK